MYNEMNVRFLSKLDNVTLARTLAVGFLVDLNLDLNTMNEIKTIISEAVTNSIVHGYTNNEDKWVELRMAYDEEVIEIEIVDEGVGIEDIEKAKEPLFTTKPLEDRAGLGFTIMEVFTDNLEIKSKVDIGTSVLMTKKYYDHAA